MTALARLRIFGLFYKIGSFGFLLKFYLYVCERVYALSHNEKFKVFFFFFLDFVIWFHFMFLNISLWIGSEPTVRWSVFMASQTIRRPLAIIRGYLQNCVHNFFFTFRGLQLSKTQQRLNLYSILGKILPISVVKKVAIFITCFILHNGN